MNIAFPGAQGWGAQTPGGEGGDVYQVTTLDDKGLGSFRTGVESRNPRIIEFQVSGTINLQSKINRPTPYLTILGQSAPGPGIVINGGGLLLSSHNMIVQHLRLRNCFISLRPWNDCHDIILANCSTTAIPTARTTTVDVWSSEPAPTDLFNITVQNCLIGLNPSRGMLTGGRSDLLVDPPVRLDLQTHHISLHHNYFVQNGHRNPLIQSRHTEVINNVVRNWDNRIGGTGDQSESDWINNYWLPGPLSNSERALVFEWLSQGLPFPPSSIYIAGNSIGHGSLFTTSDPNEDNWPMFGTNQRGVSQGELVPLVNRRFTPLEAAPIPVEIHPATKGLAWRVVNSAGAFPRDHVDKQLVDDFLETI